jgi:hypothetical protein
MWRRSNLDWGRMSDSPEIDPQPRRVESRPLTLKWDVREPIEELDLAILAILLGIGLAVGFGIRAAWYIGVAGGITTPVLVAVAFRWRTTRTLLVKLAKLILH